MAAGEEQADLRFIKVRHRTCESDKFASLQIMVVFLQMLFLREGRSSIHKDYIRFSSD